MKTKETGYSQRKETASLLLADLILKSGYRNFIQTKKKRTQISVQKFGKQIKNNNVVNTELCILLHIIRYKIILVN